MCDKLMSQYSVVIAGCCRNVEKYIVKNLEIIDAIGTQFKNYQVIIYENDSIDKTRQLLVQNKKDNCDYIFEDNVDIKSRTERIAHCRNKILEHINNNYGSLDYFLLLDLDDVLASGKLVDTIKYCFLYKPEQWDAMFANCSDKYYDIYALRMNGYLTTCCWNDFNKLRILGVNHTTAYNECVNKYIINYPENKKLMKVISAFGGAGLYKLKSISDAKYNGYEPSHLDNMICEHVPFNKELYDKGCKLYINPKMLIM
jgi:hypothetical protein